MNLEKQSPGLGQIGARGWHDNDIGGRDAQLLRENSRDWITSEGLSGQSIYEAKEASEQ